MQFLLQYLGFTIELITMEETKVESIVLNFRTAKAKKIFVPPTGEIKQDGGHLEN